MPVAEFLHGVETIIVPNATQPVQINRMAVPGVIGTAPLADAAAFPLNTPVLLDSQAQKGELLGATGTLRAACRAIWAEGGGAIVVVRVAEGADADATMTNIIGSLSAKTGVYAMLGARAATGVAPRTLIAPGFTSTRPSSASNPVVTALLAVAEKLRGRVYASTPSTSITEAIQWRDDWDSKRLVPFFPNAKVWDPTTSAYVAMPAEASNAGLTARVAREFGFWYSPSNHVLRGVGGVTNPVNWAMSDPDCEANILNENRIATMVNIGAASGIEMGGWRRWGNRNTSDDANWLFENVVTASDAVYEALEEATLWAVDKPASLQLMTDMTERANQFFKFGKREGFLIGGKCWLDPEDNTAAQMRNGVFVWRIDPEAPAPMEHIVYKAQRNADGYYDDLTNALVSIVAQG